MARSNPYRPFTPDRLQTVRIPQTSGNAINGLGEPDFRRPDVVYWAPDPGTIPHGKMQEYFYMRSNEVDGFAEARARRMEINEAPLPPIAPTPVQRDPDGWTAQLDQFVASGDCEMIGVAEMNPDWAYQGQTVPQSRVIVVGVQHDYDIMRTAPEHTAGLEVVRQYTRAGAAAKRITGWLHEQGWAAQAVTGPLAGSITMIPPALACGFGELGKHGSIINPELGASFRLSAVLTDAPFAPTPPRDHGIDDFCRNCRICEDACPPEALFPEKKTVRGELKWYVDFDKCIPFFNETHGCGICIAVCPWSRPGVGLNLAAKLERRADRRSAT
ncbi:MAG: 4Fe-4S dicluster domain-containing protein [Aestuariivita sp.]|uniref:4Fe-4S dicluster domain-containing protein n=1 Tax=Aestuariivita sp. TaxID=1872407 RepID=UPI003BB1762D